MKTQSKAVADPGSFRDPSGRVVRLDERIFRTVNMPAVDDYRFVQSTGLFDRLISRQLLLDACPVDSNVIGREGHAAAYVLEHPKLPFVSYPYEWCFSALKAAALLHLDVHLRSLDVGATLSDASAYNVQFLGPRPIFIDHLSFRRYRDGEYWTGHRQFCEQFLVPLLLRSEFGIPHNAWYRGNQEGIPVSDFCRLLGLRHKFSWRMLSHIVLPARFQDSAKADAKAQKSLTARPFPLAALTAMLRGLRRWIEGLEPADTGKTIWADYATAHSYSSDEVTKKTQFIQEFIAEARPATVWDIGCNTGDYSKACLDAGATWAIGFDADHGALEKCFARAQTEKFQMLPLFLDAANPSPSQGWGEVERPGIGARASADAVLALAFVHHVAIGRNVPLDRVVAWLTDMAPSGIVEFIPKRDPMVQRMLMLRDDVFDDYSEQQFCAALKTRATIVKERKISESGRKLFWYQRT